MTVEWGEPTVPAMLPRAQMACSLMCGWGDDTRFMKAGMAPPSTTAVVWSEVPEAMLVSAQAASNWMGGHSDNARKLTNLWMRPALMMLSMGGCFSLESSFLYSRGNSKSTCDAPRSLDIDILCRRQHQRQCQSNKTSSSLHKHLNTHQSVFTWLLVWPGADVLCSGCLHRLQSPPQTTAGEGEQTQRKEDYSHIL